MPPVPKAIRVRTSDGWQDIALRGPPGLTQVWTGPDPPSPRNDYVAWIDTDEASGDVTDRVTANEAKITALESMRLLGIQSKLGAVEVYSGGFTTLQDPLSDRTGAGALPMQISFTPLVNAWWEVTGHIGLMTAQSAVYNYAIGGVRLNPADADGSDRVYGYITQHSQVQTLERHESTRIFKLNAGVAYTAYLYISPTGGGQWNYYCGPGQLSIQGKAWAR